MTSTILPGQKWRDHTGIEYHVLCLANEFYTRPEYPVTVVHTGPGMRIWCKTKEDFMEKMIFLPQQATQDDQA